MQFNVKPVLGLICALSLAACSGGGGGENKNYAKSTADFKELAQNFARVPGSAQSIGKNNSNALDKAAISEDETVLREKSRRMQEAISQCQVDMVTPDNRPGSDSQALKFSLKIGGSVCPVKANYEFGMVVSQTQMVMNLGVEMLINDSSLAALNDVYAATINGAFKANRSGGNGSLTGKILSQKFGEVTVNGSLQASGNANSSVVSGVVSFNIKGEITEFGMKEERNQSGAKTSYSINGKGVSEQEFNDTIKDLSFLKQSFTAETPATAGF
ncbi:hypothetical protein AZI86_02670 [Bdellovibrio bacteriovorus]|uniref:Lipoprotein n=1 Tax=Bdellovibrio bacteriovorus TaxID=959 RepID=A0A150WNJ9_BDEBC|nr:hypothetical protein [Bdellovibrio bacteriovorus]KYG65990.1 hypothetical protein AZI86_02670 [Bdellovibrio bacteriovorus]